jgi:hypothetical protein
MAPRGGGGSDERHTAILYFHLLPLESSNRGSVPRPLNAFIAFNGQTITDSKPCTVHELSTSLGPDGC